LFQITDIFDDRMEMALTKHRRTLEAAAVVANLAFTFLYVNDSLWSYAFGILGPALLLALCIRERFYAEPLLQVVYILMTVYGWLHAQSSPWIVDTLWHVIAIPVCILVAVGAAYFLRRTAARYPLQDCLVTVFGIYATWLMMNQDPAWAWYFLFINALCVWMYYRRSLYLGTAMYVLYFAMALDQVAHLSIFSA
jgi:nicotinamide mononucleotide transporter